jgi:hypothetical protein
MLFQALFLAASLVAMLGILAKKKQDVLTMRGSLFWLLLWIAADVAVLQPSAVTVMANALGIGRGTDLVLYFSVVLVFVILFRLHVKLERLQRDLTKVVRQQALEEEQKRTV